MKGNRLLSVQTIVLYLCYLFYNFLIDFQKICLSLPTENEIIR